MSVSSLFADAGGPIAVVERALTFTASAVVIGACVFRWAVVRPAGRSGSIVGGIERLVAGAGVRAALLLAVVVPFQIGTQASAFAAPGDPVMPLAGTILMTTWGRAAAAQFIAALVAAVGFGGAKGVRRWGWRVAAGAAVVIAMAPAWMGHAGATDHWTWLAIAADITHVAAGGGWAGGVVILALVLAALRNQADGGRIAGVLIAEFRMTALTGASVLLATGVISALFKLRSPTDLIASTYGVLLLVKLAVVGAAAVLGRRHSRTAAAEAAAHGARSVSRSIATEAVVLLGVIVVTALLSGSPPPDSQ